MTIPERPPIVVLDGSVGLALARDETASPRVTHQLEELRAEGHRFIVPSLFWLEIINVLGRRNHAPPPATLEAIVELEAAGLETVELDRPMLLLALDAVARHGLTAYDAAYLALAEAADAQLLTADATLAAAAGARGILIGEERGIREIPTAHQPHRPSDWPSWPGAAAYLRELRSRVLAS